MLPEINFKFSERDNSSSSKEGGKFPPAPATSLTLLPPPTQVFTVSQSRATTPETTLSNELDRSQLKFHSSREAAREAFATRLQKAQAREQVRKAPEPRANISKNEDYTDVFLSHAKVYVFAKMYQIPVLKTLALEELRASLAVFHLYDERVGDIVALLRYVYAEAPPSSNPNVGWRLLQHYIATELETLIRDKGFLQLIIEDGGPLLQDVMTVVSRRLV